MEKYRNLHRWMLIPFVVMQLGIYMDYWGDFTDNAWSVHVHYWLGTTWYIFLIIQPYFASHGQLARHRTMGIIGMFLGGAVCFTALSMMNRDIQTVHLLQEDPGRFGPFTAEFFYGVIAIEVIMIVAFGYAVIKSILKRKQTDEHAWWLIASVFYIMMPALARGVQNVWIMANAASWPEVDVITPVYVSQAIIIGMLLVAAWYYGKLKHPATIIGVVINIINCFVLPIGNSEMLQNLFETVFT